MKTIKRYLAEASKRGMCGEYGAQAINAKTKKRIADVLLTAEGARFLARSMEEGWGPTPEELSESLGALANGAYEKSGEYTAALHCLNPEPVEVSQTLALIVGQRGPVTVDDNNICEIHLVNSDCEVSGGTKVLLYLYNSTAAVAGSNIKIRKY